MAKERPLSKNPSRLLASRILQTPVAMERLRSVLRRAREQKLARNLYLLGVMNEVVLPMARKIEEKVHEGESAFTENDIRQAAARLLRMGYAIG